MTILEAAEALRSRTVSSSEMTTEALDRISRLNPRFNAFITVTEEQARERATAMDQELVRGIDRGPLHGIPIAHKDIIRTRGVRTTCGSKIYSDYVPDNDATVVSTLEAAGAIMLGKTGLHEFAYGITSNNPHFGPVRNSWDPERIPGGSSGGSAVAVSTGMAMLASGTDTGGSIRIPSSFCGTVGLKPTYERISREGVFPLSWTLDHIGPMARTVRDIAIGFNAMRRDRAAYVPGKEVDIRGLRVGLPTNFYFDRLDQEVAAAVRRAVQSAAALGARIVEFRMPDMDALNLTARVILLVEASTHLSKHLDRRSDFGADVIALVDQGRLIAGTDYVDAQRLRRMLCAEFNKLWDDVDCIFTPCTPTPAPLIGQNSIEIGGVTDDVRLATTRLMRNVNVLGIPSLAIPCGLSQGGLPLGLQILAARRAENTLLRAGAAMEDANGVLPLRS